MHVVLMGSMGVGKTTIGRALAARLGRPLRDSDEDLRAEQGRSGRELAEAEGVDALHRWEAEHLRRAVSSPRPAVIAAAASVVDDEAALAALEGQQVVWLRAPAHTLAARLPDGDHRRPLGTDPEAAIDELAQRRATRYADVADVAVDVEGAEPDQVVAAVLDALGATDEAVEAVEAVETVEANGTGGDDREAPPVADGDPTPARVFINPTLDRLGVAAWRLVGIGIVFLAGVWVLGRLWVVVVAVAVATLFSRVLTPPCEWLKARGLRPALATVVTMLGFVLLLAAVVAALVPPIASQFDDLGPTLESSIDDVEDWVVNDSPFDVSASDAREFRDTADDRLRDAFSSSSGGSSSVVSGTVLAFEVVTALLLAIITSFFILKDGLRFSRWLLTFVPEPRRPLAARLGGRAWQTLGGYLKGAAALGVVEGMIIGIAVFAVGGELAIPVAVVTFFAAFIPFAGAIAAGLIAVLVTLVTAGPAQALIVVAVAVVVQQLDNDFLAPVIYGRSLELHPLVVLFSLAGGSALMGPAGALFSVPVAAVAVNVIAEARRAQREDQSAVATTTTKLRG